MNKQFFRTLVGLLLLLSFSAARAQQLDWAYQIGNQPSNPSARIMVDDDGNLIEYGAFSDSLDFDPGPQVRGIRSNGMEDLYIRKLSPAGALIWVKRIGGAKNDNALSATVDKAGNVYLCVRSIGLVDFDPGPGVTTLNTSNTLLKLDKNGNFLAVYDFGPISNLWMGSIMVGETGEIYIGGGFALGQDFDPGPGYFHMSATLGFNKLDAFLIKLTAEGNLIWGKKWGAIQGDYINSMVFDKAGNILASGPFEYKFDFDPGPGVTILEAVATDRFLSKFDTAGNFIWVKQFDAYGTGGLKIDPNGNIILGGEFGGSVAIDFDPGPGEFLISSHGNFSDQYLLKLDAEGNFLWATGYGGVNHDYLNTLDVDELGNIYSGGTFSGTADFDPGPDELNVTVTKETGYILKTDFLGNTVWLNTFGGGQSYISNMRVSANGSLYVSGEFETDINLFPGWSPPPYFISYGDSDAFLMKIKQNQIYTGTVFRDANSNGIRDAGEIPLKGIRMEAANSGHHTVTNDAGQYYFYYDLLGDTIRPAITWPNWTSQPAFALPNATQAPMNFALKSTAAESPDVAISIVELTPFRPGFETEVHIIVNNLGTQPLADIPVELKTTSQLLPNFIYSSLPVLEQNPDFLKWNITQLPLYGSVTIVVKFKTQIGVANNTPVQLQGNVWLAEDVYQTNNQADITTLTVGSYDPNDKQVTPALVESSALDTTELRYVIRFQNTGNYPADFVVIRDTLPLSLDLSTLRVLGASHPFNWRLVGARVLEFRFDPIHLPDSTTNEPASHGFVAFVIKPVSGLTAGTSVLNRAGIYFDFNPPIITEYAAAQVVETLAAKDLTTPDGFEFLIQPNPLASEQELAIILPSETPLPVQVSILDQYGRVRQTLAMHERVGYCKLNDLTPGAYFVQVRSGMRVGGKVLVVK